MDISILTVLTGIYKLAQKNGLIDYLIKYRDQAFDTIFEKAIGDTAFEDLLKKLFQNTHGKCFETALGKIAPKNETIKRRILLAVLTEPKIAAAYQSLQSGILPDRRVLIPIFEKEISCLLIKLIFA